MAKKEYANYWAGSKEFLEKVYFRGLAEIIRDCSVPMQGTFGKTVLVCVMHNGLPFIRLSCFSADFGDEYANREMMDFADFRVDDDGEGHPALFLGGCVMTGDLPKKMFDDVIAHWPADAARQKATFSPLKKQEST